MALDLTHLTASLAALDRAQKLSTNEATWSSLSDDLKEAVTAAIIQSFEVAYEQSWKAMRRWLTLNLLAGSPDEGTTLRQVFRMAAKAGLIDDVDLWLKFRDARNKTSHTYDGDIAQAVVEVSHLFLPVAKIALASMESKND